MRPDPMSKLVLIGLCTGLLACAERQAEYYIDQLSDPRSQIRLDASHALVQLGGATVEPLIEHCAGAGDSLQYIAAQILGQIGDHRATPFLKDMVADDNCYVREQAVRALGQLANPRLGPNLEAPLFTDSGADVRKAAAWSMGNLRDTTAVTPLIRALEDSVAAVRQQALAALQFLWTPAAEAAAIAALEDPDGSVRYVAAQMLGHHRIRKALDPLFTALNDNNIWVRVESARALGKIGDTTAVAKLERMFSSREGPDQEAAQEALQQLTGLNYAVAPE